MIESDRQHSHVGAVSKCCCPSRLRNSEGINGINSLRRSHAEDLFPLQALVPVDLLPRVLTDLAQRIQCRMTLGFLQRKQVFLKGRIVQVQYDPRI